METNISMSGVSYWQRGPHSQTFTKVSGAAYKRVCVCAGIQTANQDQKDQQLFYVRSLT